MQGKLTALAILWGLPEQQELRSWVRGEEIEVVPCSHTQHQPGRASENNTPALSWRQDPLTPNPAPPCLTTAYVLGQDWLWANIACLSSRTVWPAAPMHQHTTLFYFSSFFCFSLWIRLFISCVLEGFYFFHFLFFSFNHCFNSFSLLFLFFCFPLPVFFFLLFLWHQSYSILILFRVSCSLSLSHFLWSGSPCHLIFEDYFKHIKAHVVMGPNIPPLQAR